MRNRKPTPRVPVVDPESLPKHTAKISRPHVAMEYREARRDADSVDQLVRGLKPWARRDALGLNSL